MLEFFGAKDGATRTHQARTKEELEDVLTRPEFENPKGIHVSLIISRNYFDKCFSVIMYDFESKGGQANEVSLKLGPRNSHRQDGFPVAIESFW
jgi:hypothetical protein